MEKSAIQTKYWTFRPFLIVFRTHKKLSWAHKICPSGAHFQKIVTTINSVILSDACMPAYKIVAQNIYVYGLVINNTPFSQK